MSRPFLRTAIAFSATLFASLSSAHEDPIFLAQKQAAFKGPVLINPGSISPLTFPANNVSLLAWFPLATFGNHSSGNDCWGYVSPSGREYALVGLSDGTAFVEVTDPGQPVIVSVQSGPNSLWRDIKVYQDRAYAVSEGGSGIQVFNLSQIDNGVVTFVTTVTTGGTTATHNVAIDEVSGFLYRCGGGSNGIRIYSLANKDNPTFVGEWNNRYVHDAQVVTYTSGTYAGKQVAFCFSESTSGGGSPAVDILDVTNKGSITSFSQAGYSNAVFSHQGWLTTDRKYLYVDDELDESSFGTNTTTRIINVTNLSAPFFTGTFSSGLPAIDHNLYVRGNMIYEANYRSGLRVFDATNPTAPTQVAWFDTYPEDDQATFNSLWNAYPFLPSGTIIGSDLEKGMFVWRLGAPQLTFSFPNGLNELIDPMNGSIVVQIDETTPGDLLTGSARLHYDAGAGFVDLNLVALGGGLFRANFPPLPCGVAVSFYLSAKSTNGITWSEPAAGSSTLYHVTPAYSFTTVLSADMETDPGWTAGASGDNATTGIWTRVNPVGTAAAPEDDHTAAPGSICWVTGQGSVNGGLGDADVDGGKTTLVTSTINLSGGDAEISYWRWYSNNTGGEPNNDVLRVDISNNNGGSWVNAETVGPNGADVVGGWVYHAFNVSSFVTPTSQVRLRFVVEDAAGGSIIEAAIDDFRVSRYDCSVFCQTNLGFAGPGNVTLSLCGGQLNTGNQATLLLAGAPSQTTALLVVGLQSNPTPLLGGMLVPVPVAVTLALTTNTAGEVQFVVPGGGGPATLFLQFVVVDPSQALGVELSNALQVTIGS